MPWATPLRPETLFEVPDAVRQVGDPLFLVADLALNAEWPAIADFLQGFHELLDVYLPLAERHLLAPGSRHFGAVRVFDMHAANVRAEDLHGPQRVALVVEKH